MPSAAEQKDRTHGESAPCSREAANRGFHVKHPTSKLASSPLSLTLLTEQAHVPGVRSALWVTPTWPLLWPGLFMLLMDSWSEEMPAELGAGGDLEVRVSELPAQSTSQEPLSHGRSGPEQAEPPSSQTHLPSGREKMNEWRRLLPGLWTVRLS